MYNVYIFMVFFFMNRWVAFKNNLFNFRISSKSLQNSLKSPKTANNTHLE